MTGDKQHKLSSLSTVTCRPSLSERSHELEHLDKGDYTVDEYEGCLIELRRINRFLGDAGALRKSLLRSIERDEVQAFSVLDVGAGSGELLRTVARWARGKGKRTRLVGVELNRRSAIALVEESRGFAEIASVRADGFRLPFADNTFEYVMCSLFTHHFTDDDVVRLLRELMRVARRGIIVIDLHRHRFAYLLYTSIGRLVLHNRLVREDGALSIRRGFRQNELRGLAERAGLAGARVTRRFPFRLVLEANKKSSPQL